MKEKGQPRSRSTRDEEIVDLVVAYARQETIEPLRGVGRWIAWGLVSMSTVSIGVVMVSLGLLRLVQDLGDETLDASWSFVPYLVGSIFAAGIVFFAATRIRREQL